MKNLKTRFEKFLEDTKQFDKLCSNYNTTMIEKIRAKNSNMIRAITKILRDME